MKITKIISGDHFVKNLVLNNEVSAIYLCKQNAYIELIELVSQ